METTEGGVRVRLKVLVQQSFNSITYRHHQTWGIPQHRDPRGDSNDHTIDGNGD